jgi:outer membrane protein OmpA-like peptidoglycan-associated protein
MAFKPPIPQPGYETGLYSIPYEIAKPESNVTPYENQRSNVTTPYEDQGSNITPLLNTGGNVGPREKFIKNLSAEEKPTQASSTKEKSSEGTVFGTFDLSYPVENIEREKTDGTTLINLSPECRVFICGAEVTKDVIRVSSQYSLDNGGMCDITLANPRGKYTVNPTDLVGPKNQGSWREDKSILQTYDYEWLQKPASSMKMTSSDSATIKGATTIDIGQGLLGVVGKDFIGKDVINTVNSISQSFKNLKQDKTLGVTQMLYDIKHHSGLSKKIGEIIFDFRDPVFVFYKGRFSSYWYFGFTGVVIGFNEGKIYGSEQTITLQAGDPIQIFKRRKFTERGSIIRARAMESRATNFANAQHYVYQGIRGDFPTLVKTIFFSRDTKVVEKIVNYHFYYTPANTFKSQDGNPEIPYNVSQKDTREKKYMNVFRTAHEFKTDVNPEQLYTDGQMIRDFPLQRVGKGPALTKKAGPKVYPILFSYDSRDPLKGSQGYIKHNERELNNMLTYLKSMSTTVFKLVGYTDLNGGVVYNEILSRDRATAVRKWLIQQGIKEEQLHPEVEGKGKQSPIEPGPNKNNRNFIPIKITDQGDIQKQDPISLSDYDLTNRANHGFCPAGFTVNGKSYEPGLEWHDYRNRRVELVPISNISETDEAKTTLVSSFEFNNWFVKNKAYLADPDSFRFSPWTDLYLQYNQIDIEDLTEHNLKPFYDSSVRYWSKNFTLLDAAKRNFKTLDTGEKQEITGWAADRGFGVCGIHPALTYDFINNFHRVSDVYNASINPKTGKPELLDSIVISPLEKLREMVFGSPTELTTLDNEKEPGTQRNYFRPRLFFIWPRKFRGVEKEKISIAQLSLFDENSTTVYDAIEKITNDTEYVVYASPMGDIFIEPNMYDFHPVKFFDKIEARNPIAQEEDILFRVFVNEVGGESIAYIKDKAYYFNLKANYPLFITNKDTMRVQETLKPELVKTSAVVTGSISGTDGIVTNILSNFYRDGGAYIDISSPTSTKDKASFPIGIYVADGFPNKLFGSQDSDPITVALNKKKQKFLDGKLNSLLLDNLNANKGQATIKQLWDSCTAALKLLAKQKGLVFYHSSLQQTYDELQQDLTKISASKRSQYVVNNIPQLASTTIEGWIVLYNIAPDLHNELKYFSTKDKKGKITTLSSGLSGTGLTSGGNPAFVNPTKIPPPASSAFLNEHGITTADALLSKKISDIVQRYTTITRSGSSNPTVLTSLFAEDQDRSAGSATGQIIKQMMNLYEGVALQESGKTGDEFRGVGKQLTDIVKANKLPTIITRGVLKELSLAGEYNPRTDFVTRYGVNPGPTIHNPFISTKEEAAAFSKILLNRIVSKAFEIHVDIIGRPELMLNRPYYIEDKQAIGSLQTYSIDYSIESPFQSNCQFSYIRRNSITYSYTTKNLDDVAEKNMHGDTEADAHASVSSQLISPDGKVIANESNAGAAADQGTNLYFNKKAISYHKDNYKQKQGVKNAINVQEFFNAGGSSKGLIPSLAGIAGQTLGQVLQVSTFGGSLGGGLFVAHAPIGHINYDKSARGSNDRDVLSPIIGTSELLEDPRFGSKLGQDILTKDQVDRLHGLLVLVDTSFVQLQEIEKELVKLDTQVTNFQKTKSDLATQKIDLEIQRDELKESLNQENVDPKNAAEYMKLEYQIEQINIKLSNDEKHKKTITELQTSTLEEYKFLGQQIYGDAFTGTFDAKKGVKAGRVRPTKPFASQFDTTGNLSLLQELYTAIPSFSSYDSTVQIRNKWGVLDDIDLDQEQQKENNTFGTAKLYLKQIGISGVAPGRSGVGGVSPRETGIDATHVPGSTILV